MMYDNNNIDMMCCGDFRVVHIKLGFSLSVLYMRVHCTMMYYDNRLCKPRATIGLMAPISP